GDVEFLTELADIFDAVRAHRDLAGDVEIALALDGGNVVGGRCRRRGQLDSKGLEAAFDLARHAGSPELPMRRGGGRNRFRPKPGPPQVVVETAACRRENAARRPFAVLLIEMGSMSALCRLDDDGARMTSVSMKLACRGSAKGSALFAGAAAAWIV